MNSLLTWSGVNREDWDAILARSLWWAEGKSRYGDAGKRKSIALMFFNDSLRTKVSMELAAVQLGAHPTVITPGSGTWNFAFEEGGVMDGAEAEHINEAVGVLSGMYDAIGVRLFASGTDFDADKTDRRLNQIVNAATVPVINLESAFYHPCQALADATTLMERFDGDPIGKKFVLAWTTHPKALPMAVPNSTLLMAARLGMDVTVARPQTHALDESIMSEARNMAASFGQNVTETDNLDEVADGAHVVYAKSWGGPMAYHAPAEEASARAAAREWTINSSHMGRTAAGLFMHCLPVRRNVVVTDEVLQSSAAVHQRQAQCRLAAQKAIMEHIWMTKNESSSFAISGN